MENNLPNKNCGNYKVFVNNLNGAYQLLISGTGINNTAAQEIAILELNSDIGSVVKVFCDKLNYALNKGYLVSKNMLRHQDGRALQLTFLLEQYSERFFRKVVMSGLMKKIN